MKPRLPVWSQEEEKILRNGLSEGFSKKEIASMLSRTEGAIRGKAERLRLVGFLDRRLSKKDQDSFKKMLGEGKSIKEISLLLCRPISTLYGWTKRLGLQTDRTILSKEIQSNIVARCTRCKQTKPTDTFRGLVCYDCILLGSRLWRNNSLQNALIIKLGSSRRRAKKMNWEFDITLEDLLELWRKQNGKCYYSGAALSFLSHERNGVSVDRVDPLKGYTKKNTVLCAKIVNTMKLDLSVQEFLDWCEKISKRL